MKGVYLIMRRNESQPKANTAEYKNAWQKQNVDRINLTVPKGEKDKIKAHAEKKDNGSINGFVNRAIRETMERDNVEGNE